MGVPRADEMPGIVPVLGEDGIDGNERRGQSDCRAALNESFRVLLVTRVQNALFLLCNRLVATGEHLFGRKAG
jgi:hypothetical protein